MRTTEQDVAKADKNLGQLVHEPALNDVPSEDHQ